ncbi:hypothetical protein H5410_057073 [Solanum commersonii]|uniref:Uncharacterized protein n=1 Tax=Solanum commersonii TaxID=4109 RepID=A0A9J5WLZ2_SOLCO|nr:hypothetical protein H5410_057073 [Solanum commersonii]
MDKLKEKSELGDFCAQFGLPDPSAKSSNKSRYYKSSRTEGSNNDYESDSDSDIELLDLSDNDKNCDSPCTTAKGLLAAVKMMKCINFNHNLKISISIQSLLIM